MKYRVGAYDGDGQRSDLDGDDVADADTILFNLEELTAFVSIFIQGEGGYRVVITDGDTALPPSLPPRAFA